MREFDLTDNTSEEDTGSDSYKGRSPGFNYQQPTRNYIDRIAELEIENSRLHRLVAELLIKNQQLRRPD